MKTEISYDEALQKLDSYKDGETLSQEDSMDIISALSKVHANDKVDDNWDDFDAMIKDMQEHAKDHDQAIVMADRPTQLRLAWKCEHTGKTWSIKIGKLREYLNQLEASDEEFDKRKANILRDIFMTQEDKKELLASINDKY